jgi:putative flippase GtrA
MKFIVQKYRFFLFLQNISNIIYKKHIIFAPLAMRKFLIKISSKITELIDFFYPPFSSCISRQVFHYAACGGAVVLLDWVLYFLVYNFVLDKQLLHLKVVTLSPHIATLAVTFPITVLIGFLLQKYVTFTASYLRGHVQLFRYFLVVMANLAINYAGLKLLVDGLHFFPTPSKMIITVFTVIFSYISQEKFTFKSVKPE